MGLMKESLVEHASNVCGKRFVGGCMRRGRVVGRRGENDGGREKEGF